MNKFFVLLLASFSFSVISAQDTEVYKNEIYSEVIRTVRLHPVNSQLDLPLLSLNGNSKLILYFDDLEAEIKDYYYSVEHCNYDWTSSGLSSFEYINGFNEAEIQDNDYSFGSYTSFVHYRLTLPNNDIRFKISGNYILKVYEEDDYGDKTLAFTRRFMIVDTSMKVEAKMNLPAKVNLQRTHQELDFTVHVKEYKKVKNALSEINAVVVQNQFWDSAIYGLKPAFVRGSEMIFDYQNKIVFPALKEWRFVDLRSLRYPSNQIEVKKLEEGYDVYVDVDRKRDTKAYLSFNDINGNYVIEYQDNIQLGANIFYEKEDHLRGDYVLTYFALDSPGELYDHDVYVFGALSDWRLQEEFKMEYNEKERMYETSCWLKQGYFNYMYAAVPKGTSKVEFEETEGNWYETENNYYILIYHRPFGQRYDALTAVQVFSSFR